MGMSLSGAGLGAFVYPLVANQLIAGYGWRGALIISSGFILNVCVFAILIGPDPPPEPFELANKQKGPSDRRLSAQHHTVIKAASMCHSFTRFHYWLLHVESILTNASMSILGTHVIAYGQYNGHSPAFATSLLAAVGLSGLVARILHGAVTHHPSVRVSVYFTACLFLVAVSLCTMTAWTSAVGLMLSVVTAGYFISAQGPVFCEVLLEICGPEDFSYGYGFACISNGAGYVLGAPCAGLYTNQWKFQCTSNVIPMYFA